MIRYLIAVAALASATVAIPQSTPLQRAEKARTEVNDLRNGAARALYAIDQLLAALKAPVPAPSPLPSPTAAPTVVPASSLTGVAAVSSGIANPQQYAPTSPWGIPGFEAKDIEGAFRFICKPSHNAYDDPVVFPGQAGRSHLHTFFGNTLTNASSTYQSLRTTGDSTCNNILNRSAYWVPAMMNGRGKVVMPNWIQIYYKGTPATSPECTKRAKACIALPRGLRYIFGHNMIDPRKSSPGTTMYWNCTAEGAQGHFANIAQAAKNCPIGSQIGMVMTGPDCWNGTELDSQDHVSHLAYSEQNGYGVSACPKTHPYMLPHFTVGVWYDVDDTLDRSGDEAVTADTWYLSSDRMPGMAPAVPGTTLHADWFGAWEDATLASWHANCIDKALSCSGGDLGNGTYLKVLPQAQSNGSKLVDPPARTAT